MKFRTLFVVLVIVWAAIAGAQTDGDGQTTITIKNAALLISMDPELGEGPLGLLHDRDLVITGDSITHVGDVPETGGRVIDATGMIVMPGFVDTHNHLWQSLIRGCGLEHDLHGWLDECQWASAGAIDETDTYALVRLTTLDLIATGVTTTTDWSVSSSSGMVAGNILALEESRLRFVYAYFDWHCNVDDCSKAAATRKAIIDFKRRHIDPNPLATLQTASHPIAPLAPSVRNMVMLAKELGITFNAHYLENKNDPHGDVNGRHPGMTAILKAAGAFDGSLQLNHAVHATDTEMDYLAGRGVRIAHNPLSNMRLASGVMRLGVMHVAGLKVGLGLDGGANDTSDFFNLMRIAVGLQRAVLLDAGVYPGVADVLRMATLGGAEVLGLDDKIGSLTPGKQADVIIIDPREVNFAPNWNWVNQLVFNAQPRNVQYVLVAGKVLKRQGRIPGDHKQAVRAAEAAVAKVKERLKIE